MMWPRLRRLTVLLIAAVALVLGPVSGCQTNPATGRSQLVVLDDAKEASLGAQAAPEFTKGYGGPIPDPAVRQYVSNLGLRLARISERPDLAWEITALDSAVINAFALPGGKVFVTRGLLAKLDSEAQLAGVLGHEVGHVTAKHINDRMVQQYALSGVLIGLGVAAEVQDEDWLRVLGVGAQAGGTLYLLSYSRSHEHEADDLGLRYMERLGYNPMAQAEVMRILARESKSNRGLEFLQTHPDPEGRAKEVEEIVAEKYPHTQNNPQYVMGKEAYARQVLTRLQDLPPPKHTAQSSGDF